MSTMNPLDPYGGTTPPIEQMLGNAYDNVRKVAQNINVIKAVDANKENIDKAAQISDDVLTLKEEMEVAVSTSQAAATSATSSADVARASELSAKNDAISANQSAQSASQSANTATSLVGSVKKAILHYNTFAEAQAAAATLPDGQVVVASSEAKTYKISDGVLEFYKNLRIASRGGNRVAVLQGNAGELRADTKTVGICIELDDPITGFGSASTYQINRVHIKDDQIDAEGDSFPGSKVAGFLVEHYFGGAGASGGRHAGEFRLVQKAINSSVAEDRNYVGLVSAVTTTTGDGGTEATPKGSYFSHNFYTALRDAVYANNAIGCESNVDVDAGSSVKYRSAYTAVSAGINQGYDYDAAYAVGALGTSGAQWRDGFLVGPQNGRMPLSRSIIRNESNVSRIIYSKVTPDYLFESEAGDYSLSKTYWRAFQNNFAIQIGGKTSANTPYLEYYTGANTWAGRIIANGGGATNGDGILRIDFASCRTRELTPQADNTSANGAASLRWTQIYSASGTINTSDEREKEQWRDQSEAEKEAALEIKQSIKGFKFSDSVNAKGESSRWHFGVGAQTVGNILRDHGLNPEEYAFWCYDEWGEQSEIKDGAGNVTQEFIAAGGRYGIRYDELAMFILAAI